jgi:hypothetical protein
MRIRAVPAPALRSVPDTHAPSATAHADPRPGSVHGTWVCCVFRRAQAGGGGTICESGIIDLHRPSTHLDRHAGRTHCRRGTQRTVSLDFTSAHLHHPAPFMRTYRALALPVSDSDQAVHTTYESDRAREDTTPVQEQGPCRARFE